MYYIKFHYLNNAPDEIYAGSTFIVAGEKYAALNSRNPKLYKSEKVAENAAKKLSESCVNAGIGYTVCEYGKEMESGSNVKVYSRTETEILALIEKDTPKKPIRASLADRACPACDAYIPWDALNDPIEDAPRYCKWCGQKLDWSEEKGYEPWA